MPVKRASARVKKTAKRTPRRTAPTVAPKLVTKGRSVPAEKVWQGVRWLRQNSMRGLLAAELWCLLWVLRDPETGRIAATRQQIADSVRTAPANVSRLMTELVNLGVVRRRRERVAGQRGPGLSVYILNERARFPQP